MVSEHPKSQPTNLFAPNSGATSAESSTRVTPSFNNTTPEIRIPSADIVDAATAALGAFTLSQGSRPPTASASMPTTPSPAYIRRRRNTLAELQIPNIENLHPSGHPGVRMSQSVSPKNSIRALVHRNSSLRSDLTFRNEVDFRVAKRHSAPAMMWSKLRAKRKQKLRKGREQRMGMGGDTTEEELEPMDVEPDKEDIISPPKSYRDDEGSGGGIGGGFVALTG